MSSPFEWFLENPHAQDSDVPKIPTKKVFNPPWRIEDFKVSRFDTSL
jgi:hypothetical protein